MAERGSIGTVGREASIAALGGPRRSNGLSAADGGIERGADRTTEKIRRSDPGRARTLDAKLRTFSTVLVGERERRLYLLGPSEVDYIESRGNYVEFHAEDLVFISRDSITRLGRVLAASGYIRIQRTLLVNVQSILYAQRSGRGRFAFTLSSGARLCSGSKYREEILRILPLTRARRQNGS